MNSKHKMIANIAANARLTIVMLSKLTEAQLIQIEDTDTNWCEQFARHGYANEAEAISAALVATYEEIIK